jgi:hypothetical protein
LAAAVTPRYPLHESCAAGPSIETTPSTDARCADALDEPAYIAAGILAHYPELGKHVMRV